MELTIFYTCADQYSPSFCNEFLAHCPHFIQKKINQYQDKNKRESRILGQYLLHRWIDHYQINKADFFEKLQQQPFSSSVAGYFFSLSYTSGYAFCAMLPGTETGIDAEKMIPIDISVMKSYFASEEWQAIIEADDPQRTFYRLWTQKEALLKASGQNLKTTLLAEVPALPETLFFNGRIFHTRSCILFPDIMLHMATAKPVTTLKTIITEGPGK